MPAWLFDWKIVVAILAVAEGSASFVPYFWEIFRRKTTPHIYTWLVWLITQGTATVGIIYGHGGIIGYGLIFGTFLVFLIFLLCFKYGTKNITRSDTVVLAFAFLAILVWWQLHNPVLSIFMVGAIDGLGYIPTYRKLWNEPWSESLSSWVMFSVAYVLSLLALTSYNLLTVPYLLICLLANVILIGICLVRRPLIPKPV